MDYNKKQYRKKRQQRKSKVVKHKQKEIKFHANIEEHDFETKMNHILKFLKKGDGVKISLYMRGREMANKDRAWKTIRRVEQIVKEEEIGEPDNPPKLSGHTILLFLNPISNK